MAYRIFLALLFLGQVLKAQVFLPAFSGSKGNANLNLNYQIFSTHGGSGATDQYIYNPTTAAEFDKLFNTSVSGTTLHAKGKINSAVLLDWGSSASLTAMGIPIPNGGDFFSVKIQGTFIPTETGTYTFAVNGDDGIDLRIENSIVIAYYGAHGLLESPIGNKTGIYSMVAGRTYTFTLRMQEAQGGEGLQFYWKPPKSDGAESGGYKKNFIQIPEEVLSDRFFDGSTAARAAPSAQYIKNLTGTNTDGVYWINLPVAGPTQIYCLMNSVLNGGGWMMMMKATTGNTFNYDANYWTTTNTFNPTQNNRNDGDAKFNTMNYYPAKDLLALWPDLASNYGGSTTGGSINLLSSYNNWCWLQNDFNNGIRITPVNFWAAVDRIFLGDANNFAGKGSMFSTQTDVRFYGFNFRNTSEINQSNTNSRVKVRWGFGWNENGGGVYPGGDMTSDDASGGIGVKSDTQSTYSAGDYWSCCTVNAGMKRTARVEIYVR